MARPTGRLQVLTVEIGVGGPIHVVTVAWPDTRRGDGGGRAC
jgi:hypothetical protein